MSLGTAFLMLNIECQLAFAPFCIHIYRKGNICVPFREASDIALFGPSATSVTAIQPKLYTKYHPYPKQFVGNIWGTRAK
jgi:hypothetical protein